MDTFKGASAEALEAITAEKAVRRTNEVFLLFPMGSQFDHLIRQQVERLGLFCLVADPATVTADDVAKLAPIGIVVSGGPASVHSNPPPFDGAIFDLGIPTLGICLGFQMWAFHRGHRVIAADHREYGRHMMAILDPECALFDEVGHWTDVLESHGDMIVTTSPSLKVTAETKHAPVAAGRQGHLWGVQFHPEVSDTDDGAKMIENFCVRICGAKNFYPAEEVAHRKGAELAKLLDGGKKVLLALSGGTDSSVLAYLLAQGVNRELGRIRGVYIRGIDRPDDEANVRKHFGALPWLDLRIVDATDCFLKALEKPRRMHAKRLAMRGVYKSVLEAQLRDFGADFVAQGTLYTDISESGGGYASGAPKDQIKLHHNVDLGFNVPELLVLADCVKDGVRGIGRTLGVPEEVLYRHPFPGPGLIVRIEGKIKRRKLAMARQIDGIFMEELRAAKLYESTWQAGARILASHTTCTKGDGAATGSVVELFAVTSVNGFTAQVALLPLEFLRKVSQRLTNEVEGVGRVVYNLSDKPPATIEMG